MQWRGNLDCGCVMRSPCFCQVGLALATARCPVHVLWPAIRPRVSPGNHLFSAANARNFNRILRAALLKLKTPEAARYSSHGFRRGAAQDLETYGSPWEVIASAGIWNSPAFRCYLDLAADVEQGVRNLFAVDHDSDSARRHCTPSGICPRKSPWPAPPLSPWETGISDPEPGQLSADNGEFPLGKFAISAKAHGLESLSQRPFGYCYPSGGSGDVLPFFV